jgi:hypothetical protein
MSAGDFPARGRLKAAFALIGVLALIVGLAAASAQAGGGTATTAKKCKKKSRSAGVAKKKCKKKKPSAIILPAPPAIPAKPPIVTPPAPTEEFRAELNWTGATDLDLEVYLSATEYDYQDMAGPVQDIPDATLGSDSATGGPEDFLDQLPPFDREFTFAVCYYGTDIGAVNYTLDWVDSGGNVHNDTGTLDQDPMTAPDPNDYYTDGGSYDPGTPCT